MIGEHKRAFRSTAMFGLAISLFLVLCIIALCLFGRRIYPNADLAKPYWSNSVLIWTSAVSSVVYGIGTLFVSVLLAVVQRRRPDLPFNWALLFLAVFLFAFGIVSLISFVATWHLDLPMLWIGIGLKIFGAVVAIITAFLFWRILPSIMALPTVDAVVAEREARALAEAELQAKREVVKQAGHELRGPLTPILAALDDLHGDSESVTLLRRSVQQMASSITNTLESFGIGPVEPPTFREAVQPIERILVVEDHPDTARVFTSLLTRAGYEVQRCDTGAAARNAARTGDFLLCDIGLPDESGWSLMGDLSQRGFTGIAISGFATAEDKCRSAECGFLAHLTKPVEFTKLVEEIRRHEAPRASA
jgi:CheY-like chemotaxis protein